MKKRCKLQRFLFFWDMNIGFDAKRLFNNFTGLGNYSRTLVKNLNLYHNENEYFLYTPKANPTQDNEYFINQENITLRQPKHKLLGSYWRTFELANLLDKDKIDIYHGLSHELPLNIVQSKAKSVVTIHDLIFKIYPETYPKFDRYIYDSKFKYSCQKADTIVAISECTKNDIIKFYGIAPEKIKVIYQSCNPLFFTPSLLDAQTVLAKYNLPAEYLLYVGAIAERKNIITLIKAYSLLKPTDQIPLVLVGSGKEYLEKCKNLAKELKIDHKIIWLNNLWSNSELQIVYQNANCFIYPSVYEGFGIPIIEALLSGTPVVASNTSCLPEAGGSSSLYFDPLNAEQLSSQIATVLNMDSLQKQQIIKQGKDFATQKFNAEATSTEMMQLYQSLL
jgi:glycosyltransferase involved in cell wall biosynthesis